MAQAIQERMTITVEEAARRLGIGRSLAYELVARGDLPSIKIGRLRRVPIVALESWFKEQVVESAAARR